MELNSHRFENGTIYSHWLSFLSYKIKELRIFDSNIQSLNSNSFNSTAFDELKLLYLDGGALRETENLIPQDDAFVGLNSLEVLKIEDFPGISLNSFNSNFQPLASTLLRVTIANIKSAFDPSVFFESVIFTKIENLDLKGNQFATINVSTSTFTGVYETLKTLCLRNSEISTLDPTILPHFENLKLLDLQDNKLTYLAPDMFVNVPSQNIRILIANNLWDCECNLVHLLAVVQEDDVVLCETPTKGENILDLESRCSTTQQISSSTRNLNGEHIILFLIQFLMYFIFQILQQLQQVNPH
jgi:Leucine rich repeat